MAKDLLAGFAGAEADSESHVVLVPISAYQNDLPVFSELFETHGLNFLDREKAKHEARSEHSILIVP